MKRFVIAAALVLGLASAASAADLKGVYVQGGLGLATQTEDTNVRDAAGAASLAVGYNFGKVRGEVEYLGVRNGDNGGGRVGNLDADLVNVNVYAEPFTYAGVTPFVGAGVGYGNLTGTAVRGRTDGLVYNVGLGASYAINDNWALVGQYRYFIANDASVRQNDGTFDNFKTGIASVGVRYSF